MAEASMKRMADTEDVPISGLLLILTEEEAQTLILRKGPVTLKFELSLPNLPKGVDSGPSRPMAAKPVHRESRRPLLNSPEPPEAPGGFTGGWNVPHVVFGLLCAGLFSVALRPWVALDGAGSTDPFLFRRDPALSLLARAESGIGLKAPPPDPGSLRDASQSVLGLRPAPASGPSPAVDRVLIASSGPSLLPPAGAFAPRAPSKDTAKPMAVWTIGLAAGEPRAALVSRAVPPGRADTARGHLLDESEPGTTPVLGWGATGTASLRNQGPQIQRGIRRLASSRRSQ